MVCLTTSSSFLYHKCIHPVPLHAIVPVFSLVQSVIPMKQGYRYRVTEIQSGDATF